MSPTIHQHKGVNVCVVGPREIVATSSNRTVLTVVNNNGVAMVYKGPNRQLIYRLEKPYIELTDWHINKLIDICMQ